MPETDVSPDAASTDAALIDGHVIHASYKHGQSDAASTDAALIDGHETAFLHPGHQGRPPHRPTRP